MFVLQLYNRSLSVIRSNLGAEFEPEIRMALVKRLGRGCIYSGSGNIFVLEEKPAPTSLGSSPSSSNITVNGSATLCYYCLLRDEAEEAENADGPAPETGEFLVCFRSVCSLMSDLSSSIVRNSRGGVGPFSKRNGRILRVAALKGNSSII
jgi:hypothetical protein